MDAVPLDALSVVLRFLQGGQRSNALPLPDLDHRAIKRVIKPMMGSKDFRCARMILSGIEVN